MAIARPVFWWVARDATLWTRLTALEGVMSRAGTTTVPDSTGVVRTLAPNQPPWAGAPAPSDGSGFYLGLQSGEALGTQLSEALATADFASGDAGTGTASVMLALRSAFDERVTWNWAAQPQALTCYIRFIERTALGTANPLLLLGEAGTGARVAISRAADEQYTLLHHNGTTSTTATAGAARVTDAVHELRAVLRSTGQVQLYQSIDGAAETTGGPSAASPALASAWSASTLIANVADAGTSGGADWLTLLLLPGDVPLATCRAWR